MSFIVHANHVRNFERCFTMPDRDDGDKPTWIDWIGELLDTLDDDHYALALVYEHETELMSARNIIVVPAVPISDTIGQVVTRSEALDNPAGILTVVKGVNRKVGLPGWLVMMASAGSWTSLRIVARNNDDLCRPERIVPDSWSWELFVLDSLHSQHKAARVATTDGLAQ